MVSLSIVILSNALDDDIYEMNSKCLNSLYTSENWDSEKLSVSVFIIESNKQSLYIYDKRVKVLMPEEPFNFNLFLNIGIQNTESKFIALCNNDIIFFKNWFSEILKVRDKRENLLCFSTIDRDYKTMSYDIFPEAKDYYIGWENKYHFSAWCFVVDREIFSIIGKLDETFNFYGADDDFLMLLKKYAIVNALVIHSKVKHLSQVVSKKIDKSTPPEIKDKIKYPIPDKFIKRGYRWLWEDYRYYDSFFKMYNKWGDLKMVSRIDRLLNIFPFLRKRFITKILYNKRTNVILSKITGV